MITIWFYLLVFRLYANALVMVHRSLSIDRAYIVNTFILVDAMCINSDCLMGINFPQRYQYICEITGKGKPSYFILNSICS